MRRLVLIAALLTLVSSAFAAEESNLDVTFIVTADTHILTQEETRAVNHIKAIAQMKSGGVRLTWPATFVNAGKTIPQPAAIFIAGDLSYDELLNKAEGDLLRKLYYNDPNFSIPVFPGAGNHDIWNHIGQYAAGHATVNWAVTKTIQDSWKGKTYATFQPNVDTGWWYPPHYAVTLGDGSLLVVQLNTSIGEPCRLSAGLESHGRYLEPDSSDCNAIGWLKSVLKKHAETWQSHQRVILIQHYGYDDDGVRTNDYAYRGYWWAPEYRDALAKAIAGYPVIALIHGHTHAPLYTAAGTTYRQPSFGFELAMNGIDAGDEGGRSWVKIPGSVPEYCRVKGQVVVCSSLLQEGKAVTSSAFDTGDADGRAWIRMGPASAVPSFCRVLKGSHKIACNQRTLDGFIGDTAIRDVGDAGWKDTRAWVRFSPTAPVAYCRATGDKTIIGDDRAIRCTPYSNGQWQQDVVASGFDTGWPEGRAFLDFNGDGLVDYCRTITRDGDRVSCRVSKNGQFFAEEVESGVIALGDKANRWWADVNGDSFPDFCRLTKEAVAGGGIGRVACLLTKAGATFGTTEIASPFIASGTTAAWGFDTGFHEGRGWADFDGDRNADFCRVVEANSGTLGRIECTVSKAGTIAPSYRSLYVAPGLPKTRAFVDIDGDGRADFCRITDGNVARCKFAATAVTTVPVPSLGVASGLCKNDIDGYTIVHVTGQVLEALEVTMPADQCGVATYDGTVIAGKEHIFKTARP